MLVKFTITLTAESRNELIHQFGAECKEFKKVMESVRDKGAWGPAEKVDLRFIFNSGGWNEQTQEKPDADRPSSD